ncbi:hypothetical protein GCM10027280_51720 [Micromonospora polyrhachis]
MSQEQHDQVTRHEEPVAEQPARVHPTGGQVVDRQQPEHRHERGQHRYDPAGSTAPQRDPGEPGTDGDVPRCGLVPQVVRVGVQPGVWVTGGEAGQLHETEDELRQAEDAQGGS